MPPTADETWSREDAASSDSRERSSAAEPRRAQLRSWGESTRRVLVLAAANAVTRLQEHQRQQMRGTADRFNPKREKDMTSEAVGPGSYRNEYARHGGAQPLYIDCQDEMKRMSRLSRAAFPAAGRGGDAILALLEVGNDRVRRAADRAPRRAAHLFQLVAEGVHVAHRASQHLHHGSRGWL